MNARKLAKIKLGIDAARKKSVKARDLVAIATALGRVESDRGKEPTYISTLLLDARPIAIPKHGNEDFKPGTKKNILNDLEGDWLRLKEKLDKEEKERGSDVDEHYDYDN